MEESPQSPITQALQGCLTNSGCNQTLNKDLIQKAIDELNETPERYQQELNAIKNLIAGIIKSTLSFFSLRIN